MNKLTADEFAEDGLSKKFITALIQYREEHCAFYRSRIANEQAETRRSVKLYQAYILRSRDSIKRLSASLDKLNKEKTE